MTPDQRLKESFGSVRSALEYCVDLNMNKSQSARFLGIDRSTLRERATRYHVIFPNGYATRDKTLLREVNSKRVAKMNKEGKMGRKRRKK